MIEKEFISMKEILEKLLSLSKDLMKYYDRKLDNQAKIDSIMNTKGGDEESTNSMQLL